MGPGNERRIWIDRRRRAWDKFGDALIRVVKGEMAACIRWINPVMRADSRLRYEVEDEVVNCRTATIDVFRNTNFSPDSCQRVGPVFRTRIDKIPLGFDSCALG